MPYGSQADRRPIALYDVYHAQERPNLITLQRFITKRMELVKLYRCMAVLGDSEAAEARIRS